MKQIRIIIIGFFFLCNCFQAKSQSDHLEPVNGIFNVYKFQFEYYSNVREVLFEGLTDTPEIRFLIMPSFTPENVLDIQFDKKQSKYFIIYHICEKMIWHNKDLKSVKVVEYKKEINKESVDLIKYLFKSAILKTTYPDSERIGADGEIYYFSYSEMGLKSGTIWSPSYDSKMDRLVKIGLELIGLAKNKDELIAFNDKLQDKIRSLANDLK